MTTTSARPTIDKEYQQIGVERDRKPLMRCHTSERIELQWAIVCGASLGVGFGLTFVKWVPGYFPGMLYGLAYFTGGYYTGRQAINGLRRQRFEIDFLMLVAALGAAALGRWEEGALLLFLFSLGQSLEHYAMARAKKSISSLAEWTPKTALLKIGTDVREVKVEELKIGDVILARPHTRIAADGVIVTGKSSVNQAPITGESIPVDKEAAGTGELDNAHPDHIDQRCRVFAGSLNGEGYLEIKVGKIAADSTVTRLIELVNNAQKQKSRTQHFTDRLQRYYVPAVLISVTLLLFAFVVIDEPFSKSFYRSMAVLVAASPCALALSTPAAVLSGVARAARGGVLIKGGKPLEELGALRAVAFDKTGTLTEGKPKLTGIFPLNGMAEDRLLETLIAVEQLSAHPLAVAVVKGARERLKRDVPAASAVEAIQGRGVSAVHHGSTVLVGNRQFFTDRGKELAGEIQEKIDALEKQGNTTMLVGRNNLVEGIITVMDVARSDAGATLLHLQEMGISKLVMLTGDNQRVAEAIAAQIGITEAYGNLLPEQKMRTIVNLCNTEGSVAMVGDGVNDAPAMAKSSVGIAMGAAGSDVALETADVALMSDSLSNLPFAISLGRKTNRIIKQNVAISLGMIVLLVPLAMFGIVPMSLAVIGHEGSTVVVVVNALRLLAFRNNYNFTSGASDLT